ncbi:hypothetical protein Y032_0498g2539 [Ancylostoma ceylanicum]|uniref:Uncharacterized protein n=1 Tax=Ancylostoma ceylanicum TaxID=53326 RepID=A0A016WVJ4_9BILA|nr:hypothetical protein Y032_0498g2539 [Ancylostoma ceylanicum]
MSLSGACESVSSLARLCTASAREERRILKPASYSTSSKKWILSHLEIQNAKSAVWRVMGSRRNIAGEVMKSSPKHIDPLMVSRLTLTVGNLAEVWSKLTMLHFDRLCHEVLIQTVFSVEYKSSLDGYARFKCPWQDLSKDIVNFISSSYGGEVSWSLKAFCHTCRQKRAFVAWGMNSTELQTMPEARLRPFLNEGHRQSNIL